MASSAAQEYIRLLAHHENAELALLACSAALRLDDEVASQIIHLVAQSNGSTRKLLRRIKSLGCVWRHWDGTWNIAEDIRLGLAEDLDELPEATTTELRKCLSAHAANLVENLPPDEPVNVYRRRQAALESAYHLLFIPAETQRGAEQLVEVWQTATGQAAQDATAESVGYLAREIRDRLRHLPLEVIFLQGMAARARRNKNDQLKYFGEVYEQGRERERELTQPGYICAVAAHHYGLVVRDPDTAERAYRDSLRWYEEPTHRRIVLHSLAVLIGKDRRRNRWEEAEGYLMESLDLRDDPEDKGQVYHSLGNLLSKNPQRWAEAEKAYKQSLAVARDAHSKAERWHSLGNLLSQDKNKERWAAAEDAYKQSLKVDKDARSQGQTWNSLGNLLSKQPARRQQTEEAYSLSLRLRDNAADKAQTLTSWGNFLSRLDSPEDLYQAEHFAQEAMRIDPHRLRTKAACSHILANVYEKLGHYEKAIAALEAEIEADRKQGRKGGEHLLRNRIEALRRLSQG